MCFLNIFRNYSSKKRLFYGWKYYYKRISDFEALHGDVLMYSLNVKEWKTLVLSAIPLSQRATWQTTLLRVKRQVFSTRFRVKFSPISLRKSDSDWFSLSKEWKCEIATTRTRELCSLWLSCSKSILDSRSCWVVLCSFENILLFLPWSRFLVTSQL